MNICFLGLGSNLKSKERQIRLCIAQLRQLPKTSVQEIAPFYFNQAIGRKALPTYCNTVVKIMTTLPPFHLLKRCQAIELAQGRCRKRRYDARTLDIDVLMYKNVTMNHPKLTLPHREMYNRDFVLIPLRSLNLPESVSFKNI